MATFAGSITIDDKRLKRYIKDKPDEIKDVIKVAASDIEKHAKEHVAVDTGDTKSSIFVGFEDDGFTARISPKTEYAPHIEFGTSKVSARPFMIPALESERKPFLAAIEARLKKV